MNDTVGLYKIEISVANEVIETVKRGYLNFTGKVEKYPFVRVRDVNGELWAINTRNIQFIKITKLEGEELSAFEDNVDV